ncbi:MAG: VWA domain-containing protein, partial [Planctomycetota bacterium]
MSDIWQQISWIWWSETKWVAVCLLVVALFVLAWRFWCRRHIGFGSLGLLVSILIGACMFIAALDPRYGDIERQVPQQGIEIVFLLDVSRSMMAEDVSPSRLARAKQQIRDLVAASEGDRVGLVAFAGEARQVTPLTVSVEEFDRRLADVSPNTLRRGGSRLGDAITVASDSFLDQTDDHKAMVILTDGEDMESRPIDAAKRVHAETGVRIFTIGLGDMETGARIPQSDPNDVRRTSGRFVKHQGEAVWSKMDGTILQAVATETGGAFVPAGTRRVDMAEVYERLIAVVPKTEFQQSRIQTKQIQFIWLAVPSLILIVCWSIGQTRRSRITASAMMPIARIPIMLLGVMLMTPAKTHAETADDLNQRYRDAASKMESEKWDEAIADLNVVAAADQDRLAADAR